MAVVDDPFPLVLLFVTSPVLNQHLPFSLSCTCFGLGASALAFEAAVGAVARVVTGASGSAASVLEWVATREGRALACSVFFVARVTLVWSRFVIRERSRV